MSRIWWNTRIIIDNWHAKLNVAFVDCIELCECYLFIRLASTSCANHYTATCKISNEYSLMCICIAKENKKNDNTIYWFLRTENDPHLSQWMLWCDDGYSSTAIRQFSKVQSHENRTGNNYQQHKVAIVHNPHPQIQFIRIIYIKSTMRIMLLTHSCYCELPQYLRDADFIVAKVLSNFKSNL